MNIMRWCKTALLLSLLWQIMSVPLRAELVNPKLNLKYPTLITAIYQQHPDNFFWGEPALRDEFEKQISLIVFADISDDLFYSYQALKNAKEQKNWLLYERLASDLLLFYLSYHEQIPDKVTYWLFGERIKNSLKAPSKESIDAFFNTGSPQIRLRYLQRLSPISAQQSQLYQNILKLKNKPVQIFDAVKLTEFAKIGDSLAQKKVLLSRLEISGELSSQEKQQIELENHQGYSQKLGEIIRSFQIRHGLEPDGIIGKNTLYWLNISRQERVRLMALNILRQQLWTMDNTRKVIINIPDYTMEYWEEDQKIFESKVIVGQTKRKTPLFSAQLNAIVFNPRWNVPTIIMREDILPKVLLDINYLSRHSYEIIENYQSQKVIDAETINWKLITVHNFPYRLRQKSGENNALGLYKFNTPNNNSIYLHDTPAKNLFEKQDRAFSSGCIRVQKAEQFALFLMDKSGYPLERYNIHHNVPETSSVSLKKKITVYSVYRTVWVDQFGFTQFRNDIYHYDK
ncbi:cell wall degradation protein [Psychromonas ingrahamii 37]|uniref:Cell wall degradation protein n=1 Tax=Psychromonas ingrahamii (strain DSM 17664 / CCUG 51855 / 37) TaxID=357804 RepID=A1SV97_PSYIN|nr:L,D-transpeptidase family protein [Psychromonas ingrahamii]ABM03412.1 cell wall degradation protein [Psychromonas ingrahamii 37]